MEPLNPYLEHKNIHDFLINLDGLNPKKTEKKDIKEITKKCLGIAHPFFNARTKILEAVETLRNDVSQMGDLSLAQKEIAGAINGLNILSRHETNASRQEELKGDLLFASQSSQHIQDIFLLKEAIAEEPALRLVLENPDFIKDFSLLRTLYGRRRELEGPVIISLMKAWENPGIRPLLQRFLHDAYQIRQDNLHQLVEGRIPSHADIPMAFFTNQSELNAQALERLSPENSARLKSLMDDLLNNRTSVTNTQVLNDPLFLAFNGASVTTIKNIGGRTRNVALDGIRDHASHMENLNEKLLASTDQIEQKKVEKEIENWKKLEDYHFRKIGFLYQKSCWIPTLGPDDPIQPLKIVVGFAIKEGITRESETSLDITPALGEANLNLTVKERDVLGELLVKCGLEITKKEPILENWRKTKQLPESIAIILTSFHDERTFPHLSKLNMKQIDALIDEMFRFSWESNYHLANDLLNLC